MRIPPGVRRALRLPPSVDRLAGELDAEIAFHLAMRIERLVAQGMSRDEALAEATRQFGDAEDLREYCHSIGVAHMRRVQWRDRLDGLLSDLHFAVRQMRKAPGFAFVSSLTLALGIGATTVIFSVVSGIVLRPLPYPGADRIVQLWELDDHGQQMRFAAPNFADVERQNRSFSAVAAYQSDEVTTIIRGEAIRAPWASVTPRFFDVVGVKPLAGRLFDSSDVSSPGVVPAVISNGFWQREFGGSTTALGSTIRAGDQLFMVIGIVPAGHEFPVRNDVWTPRVTRLNNTSRTAHNFRVIARLKSGVTPMQARQDLSVVAQRLQSEYGTLTQMAAAAVVPLRDQIVGNIKPTLYMLFAASMVLLLIACANVANLLVARLAVRETEIAVRLALGAARSRLVQQRLVESSLLAATGCTGGLLFAFAGIRVLAVIRPANMPRSGDVTIDWRVLVFAAAVSATTAVALGFVGAWRGARGDLRAALSQTQRSSTGQSSHRVRSTLVMTQLAMTVVLLVGAALLGRSFLRLMHVDPGFVTQHIVVAQIPGGDAAGAADLARRVQFYDEALSRLRSLPGVTSAGGATVAPLSGSSAGDGTFLVLNSADEKFDMKNFGRLMQDKSRTGQAEYRVVSGEYFHTMHIPLVAGRLFDDRERADAPHSAVVSASLVRQRWPAESPLGKVIEFGNMDGDVTPITIVGVVGDVREQGLAIAPQPTVYVDFHQRPRAAWNFEVALTTETPSAVIAGAQHMLHDFRPDVPVRFSTIENMIARSVADRRFLLLLVGVFGAAALVLATLGVYSVIAYLVTQRGREISVRVALGAQRRDIVRLVLRQGLSLAFAGAAIGAVGALVATRALRSWLYEVSPTDPIAFAGVVVLLCGVAVVASYVPARRAAKAEPMDVLRGG